MIFPKWVFIFIVLLILGFFNGYLAALSLLLSLTALILEKNEDYGLVFISVLIISIPMTFLPFLKSPSLKSIDFYPAYADGIDRALMISIKDCPNLSQPQISSFFEIKKKLLIACGMQSHNDLVSFATEFFTTIYSAIYNEFSIAASFFPPRKESNACHFYIEKMIKLCPREETFFNKKSLQGLRENFNRK